MNFSVGEWLVFAVLDMLIKVALVIFVVLLISLYLAPIIPFVSVGVGFSILHLVCLFLAETAVLSLELVNWRPRAVLKAALTIAIANILFVVCGATFITLMYQSRNLNHKISIVVLYIACLAITNFIPLFFVLALRLVARLMRRFVCRCAPAG
ncbi:MULTISPECIES: hypothetical protein [unclassified Bradyrhizobium]|uniref:hypothetical protein n=1 Tax=unclassified Bradyrhizobium TaxID=2631580 RepID=UPI0028EA5DE7|nr:MULTISPECIES: hypothetical protein [unclassified Bradyrhizobium]